MGTGTSVPTGAVFRMFLHKTPKGDRYLRPHRGIHNVNFWSILSKVSISEADILNPHFSYANFSTMYQNIRRINLCQENIIH